MGNSNANNFKNHIYNYSISDPKDNESSIYRDPTTKNSIFTNPRNGMRTMHEAYKYYFNKYSDLPMWGVRKINNGIMDNFYTWKTYKEVLDLSEKLGTNLIRLKLAPEKNEWENYNLKFIGIYSKNCLEWNLIDFACCIQGITVVPIYDTLGEEATVFAFNQTNMTTLFLTSSHLENILKVIDDNNLNHLENLVIIDKENYNSNINLKNKKLKILFFDDLLKCDEKLEWASIKESDIYSFLYTSGSTGEPKGAMISHKNYLSAFSGIEGKFKSLVEKNEVYLSYLPLAHALERLVSNYLFFIGSRYGYFNGDIKKLKDDLSILKPTVFVSVPRIFIRFYQKIKEKFSKLTGIKKFLMEKGISSKLYYLKQDASYNSKFYDFLIFNKIKNLLGGRVKLLCTGSAPIDANILDFLKICFCCPILEGYGQTETSGFTSLTDLYDGSSGHIGGISPNLELKLTDIPEMNYFSNNRINNKLAPQGEICIRGGSIIEGYYKNSAKNKETFTEDGWLHTGDVGMIHPENNKLIIIDRKKNIFKLSQGEYIAPEKLENAYKAVSFLNDIFVYGDSLQNYIVAILNIDIENLRFICSAIKVEFDDNQIEEILKNEKIKNYIINEFDKVHIENKFNSLEKIKSFYIETKLFQDLNLLSSTFKIKRHEMILYYKEIINNLYN